MAQPVPLDEATELYNRAVVLHEDDTAAAARLAFRLRHVVMKQPKSFPARVALVRTLQICGDREHALNHLGVAWELRDYGRRSGIVSLGSLLLSLADFVRAKALWSEFWQIRCETDPFEAATFAGFLGFLSGDISLIEQAASLEKISTHVGVAKRIWDWVGAAGVGADLAAHQDVLYSVVGEHQLSYELQFRQDDDSEVPVVWMSHRVDLDWPEIRCIRRSLRGALYERFQGGGISPAFLCHDLIPVPRTPVFQVA
ncbi:MAG TPA: hypothetical protein VGE72_20955 [Azospirillum sp.]